MKTLALATVILVGATTGATQVLTRRVQADHPPTGRLVPVRGGHIHLVDRPARAANAPTVLLIHGASGNLMDQMLTLGARLEGRYRVVAVDRPGFGHSTRPRPAGGDLDASSPRVQAALIREALDAIGAGPVIVVGHSYGGTVAAAFALAEKERTRGLVLLSAVTHPWPGDVAWYHAPNTWPVVGDLFRYIVAMPLAHTIVHRAIDPVFAPQAAPPDYVERAAIKLAIRPETFRANSEDMRALKAFVTDQAPRYGEITVPTAILHGDRDPTVSLDIHARQIVKQIQGAELDVLEGIGHMPHHVAVDRVVAAIDRVAARAAAGR